MHFSPLPSPSPDATGDAGGNARARRDCYLQEKLERWEVSLLRFLAEFRKGKKKKTSVHVSDSRRRRRRWNITKKVHQLWTKWNKIVQLWLLGYGKTAQPKCWRRGGGTFSCNATPTTHSGSAHWKAEMQLNFVICFRVRKFIFLMKHDSSSGSTWPDVLLRGAFSPTSQRRRLGRWQCAWSPQGVGEGWPTERFEVTFRAEWADRTDCVCYSPEKFCVLHWQARDC